MKAGADPCPLCQASPSPQSPARSPATAPTPRYLGQEWGTQLSHLGDLGDPGVGGGCPRPVLSWRRITLIPAGAQPRVTEAGTEGTTWGHRGWHRGDNPGSAGLAPRDAPGRVPGPPLGAEEGPWALWGWGRGSPALGGGDWEGGDASPRTPLTLPVRLLQPLGHQDGE